MAESISLSVCRDVRRAPLPGHTSASDGAGGIGARALRERVIGQGRFNRCCHYCSFKFGSWDGFEVHHLDGDHSNEATENLVPICFLCHLPFHIDLVASLWPGSGSEIGRIIRCPELEQPELNQLLYAVFFASAHARVSGDDAAAQQAWGVYRRLEARGDATEQEGGRTVRSGLSKVHVVARLLQDANEGRYQQRDTWLAGLRYLPPYEPMVKLANHWAQEDAAFAKLPPATWPQLLRSAA